MMGFKASTEDGDIINASHPRVLLIFVHVYAT